ncbi:MAG: DNA-binding domain-containing protein [Pseudomonadota bacterium]
MTGQTAFAQAVLDARAPVPDGVIGPDGGPAGKRFNVYRNNVIVSLMDALAEAFPVIEALIGAENFRNLSRLFVAAHPPTSPLLMLYGAEFPDFLRGFEPLSHVPYLGDVAALEQARREVYHGADSHPIDADALGRIAPETLVDARLRLAPARAVLRSPWPVAQIWRMNAEGGPPPVAAAETVLLTRPDYDVAITVIDTATDTFFTALAEGATLGVALEAATEHDARFDMGAALGLALTHNLITAVRT